MENSDDSNSKRDDDELEKRRAADLTEEEKESLDDLRISLREGALLGVYRRKGDDLVARDRLVALVERLISGPRRAS